MNFNLIRRLQQPADTKIVLLVIDGLGGLPRGYQMNTAMKKVR